MFLTRRSIAVLAVLVLGCWVEGTSEGHLQHTLKLGRVAEEGAAMHPEGAEQASFAAAGLVGRDSNCGQKADQQQWRQQQQQRASQVRSLLQAGQQERGRANQGAHGGPVSVGQSVAGGEGGSRRAVHLALSEADALRYLSWFAGASVWILLVMGFFYLLLRMAAPNTAAAARRKLGLAAEQQQEQGQGQQAAGQSPRTQLPQIQLLRTMRAQGGPRQVEISLTLSSPRDA